MVYRKRFPIWHQCHILPGSTLLYLSWREYPVWWCRCMRYVGQHLFTAGKNSDKSNFFFFTVIKTWNVFFVPSLLHLFPSMLHQLSSCSRLLSHFSLAQCRHFLVISKLNVSSFISATFRVEVYNPRLFTHVG